MNDGLVWTRRGRLVRNAVLALLFLAAVSALNTWSTPEECRGVSPKEWSDMCKKVMLN
jgi:hypothetical protein